MCKTSASHHPFAKRHSYFGRYVQSLEWLLYQSVGSMSGLTTFYALFVNSTRRVLVKMNLSFNNYLSWSWTSHDPFLASKLFLLALLCCKQSFGYKAKRSKKRFQWVLIVPLVTNWNIAFGKLAFVALELRFPNGAMSTCLSVHITNGIPVLWWLVFDLVDE